MSEKKKKKTIGVIPKFASFKSKPSSSLKNRGPAKSINNEQAPREVYKSNENPNDGIPRATSHSKPGSSHGQWQSNGGNGFVTSSSASGLRAGQNKRQEGRTDIFVIDSIGDPQNLEYGALHRSAVPQYSRWGHGGVVGSQNLKIDRARSTQKNLILSLGRYHSAEKRTKKLHIAAADLKLRKLRVQVDSPQNYLCLDGADYVPFRLPKTQYRKTEGRENRMHTSLSQNDLKRDTLYEESQRTSPEKTHNDGGISYSTEDSISDYEDGRHIDENLETQPTRAELSRAVDVDPSDCDAWFKLIDHQDHVLGINQKLKGKAVSRAERQSNAEVKVSMYECALSKAVTMEAKEKIALGLMDEGSKVWDSGTLSARWKSLLRTIPISLRLWTHYLDHKQSTFSHFRYEETRAAFLECLNLLREAHQNPNITTAERYAISVVRVYVVVRLTSFMREAGFAELSVATWQALLEYEFCKPPQEVGQELFVKNEMTMLGLSNFEEFWESEVPRIGEEGAEGWTRYVVGRGEPFKTTAVASSSSKPSCDVFGTWATAENRISLHSRQPARTTDELDEDDPYQVILFSDVRDALEDFTILPPSRSLLIVGWLTFCHLPPWTDDGNEPAGRTWYRNPYLRSDTLYHKDIGESPSNLDSPGTTKQGYVGNGHHGPVSERMFHVLPSSPLDHELQSDTLFSANADWFSTFETISHEHGEDHGPINIGMIRRTLSTLVHASVENDSLAEYFLALELKLSPETVKKTARTLIRSRPGSLRLYNAYACIEFRLLNEAGARAVISGAITNSRSLQGPSQEDAIFIWRTWAWELLGARKLKEAFEQLTAYPDHIINDRSLNEPILTTDMTVQPSVLLRAQQALGASRDQFLSLGRPIHSFCCCDLLVLLAYLSSAGSLPAARRAFDANLAILGNRFQPTSLAHELLHQSFARLLYHHATHVPLFKPAVIRDSLRASITLFPHNTILLTIYAWNETRFRIDDRVRAIIKDVVLKSSVDDRREHGRDSVIPHYFSIFTELNRSPASGSNIHTIRNAFESAVSDLAGAHCPGLWNMYIIFEKTRGDPKKARAVWWRAVQACPWVKALWMMGFQELRNEMNSEELKGLYEMMVEKDLRMHVDLIELLDENP